MSPAQKAFHTFGFIMGPIQIFSVVLRFACPKWGVPISGIFGLGGALIVIPLLSWLGFEALCRKGYLCRLIGHRTFYDPVENHGSVITCRFCHSSTFGGAMDLPLPIEQSPIRCRLFGHNYKSVIQECITGSKTTNRIMHKTKLGCSHPECWAFTWIERSTQST